MVTKRIDAKAGANLSGTVRDVLEMKGGEVFTIAPTESVYDAVAKMAEREIGALFVLDGGSLVGVISERDYARKVILQGRASRDTRVDEIMTSPVFYVEAGTPLAECMQLISERRVRHLPVLEAGRAIGVISIGDLVHMIVLQQAETIETLNTLISGPYPA